MKPFIRYALAASLVSALAAPAFATDLPSRIEPATAPYAAPSSISWSGFYVGAEFGGQFGRDSASLTNNYTGYNLLSTGHFGTNGIVGGGLVGYNYQVNQIVLGLEGDLEGSSLQGRYTARSNRASVSTEYGVGAGIRGRVGVAYDRFLPYFTGGVAFEDISHHYNNNNTFALPNVNTNSGRAGYVLGAGLEYAITPNWATRVEYRFTDYARYTENYYNLVSVKYQPQDNSVRAALIYRFPPAAPVVVRY